MAHLYRLLLVLLCTSINPTPSHSQETEGQDHHAAVVNARVPAHRAVLSQAPPSNAAVLIDNPETTQDLTPSQAPPTRPNNKFRLASLPECREDVAQFCPKDVDRNDNFQVLTCLQDNVKLDDLSDQCHMALWHYKYNLTHDNKFEAPAKHICKESLTKLPDCSVLKVKVPCLLDNRLEVTDPQCHHFLTKLQSLYFTDHRLIEKFIKTCAYDIRQYQCGRISPANITQEELHSQGEVIECLEDKIQELKDECRTEIFHLAELQSDDYHLDRPLYFACRDDREKFCADVQSGDGKVYRCLVKHKFHEQMSFECQTKLRRRQKLISKDYEVKYPLKKNCKKDIKRYKCLPDGLATGQSAQYTLATVLLCLQEQISLGAPVNPECQTEVHDAAQELMEDYSLNPKVVKECSTEIANFCGGGLKKEGKTLDCLMKLGEDPGEGESLSAGCSAAITKLLQETGAAGDYTIDRTLAAACEPVAHHLCKDALANNEGDLMIVSCLMENLYSNDMDEKCREQLLHLQFFVSRDFRLNPGIYKACHKDATNVCSAKDWNEEHELPSGMVISCLYRNSLPGAEEQISRPCADQVRRAMHQRAVDVHLIPEIQTKCLKDLGQHCTDKDQKGEEVQCLQEKFDTLSDTCKDAITKFTVEEGEDYRLDRSLVKACGRMVTKFCQDFVTQRDTEGIIPCLIANKNHLQMDLKCQAGIEHWQLLELNDFKFAPLFKEACKKDVKTYCGTAKKKAEVVKCLSKHVHEDVMKESQHRISEKCRSQLKVELLEKRENIRLDPELYEGCQEDVKKFCDKVKPGDAKVIECLKDHQQELSQGCHIQLFNREKEEAFDNTIDYALMRGCKQAILIFCGKYDNPDEIFECLKKRKHDEDMDPKCRTVITKRQKLQSKDIRLNPEMEINCKMDVIKFCKKEHENIAQGKLNEGKMISCLKKHKEKLSEDCEFYVRNLEKEAALDYRLDPELSKDCAEEIKKLCSYNQPGKGDVEKCLKAKVGEIKDKKCLIQIERIAQESQNDISVDPILYQSCLRDINKECSEVIHGDGRVMKCLLQVHTDSKQKLSKQCRQQLDARLTLWSQLSQRVEIPAEIVNIPQLAAIVSVSPSRNYFYVVFFVCLALIFLGGLVFGRISKRVRQEFKSR